MKTIGRDAIVHRVLIPAAIVVALAGSCLAAFARSTETVYLYVNGTPTLQASDSYDGGLVVDSANNQIGTVPNPTTDGHIYNSSGTAIGFISPSPASNSK